MEIPLTRGKVAIIDAEDYELVRQYKWHTTSHGYAACSSCPYIYMHRLILGANKNQLVDHKNFNTLDNRKENIRLCTKSENQRYQRKRGTSCASNYRGVHFFRRDNLWIAQIRIDGKTKHLGRFKSEIEAARAYNKASTDLYGSFGYVNQI